MTHGGNIYLWAQRFGCRPEDVVDFSANINPEQAIDTKRVEIPSLTPYADPDHTDLKRSLAARYPYPDAADLEIYNGASAAIFALIRFLQPSDIVCYAPLYGEYEKVATALGANLHFVNRLAATEATIPEGSTVIFVNPSTPDGQLHDMQEYLEQWQARRCNVIVDESFLDFCKAESVAARIPQFDNLYLIKSLSKFYGCAGIRIGFIVAAADAIRALRQFEPAWKLSTFDAAYIQHALANREYIAQTRESTLRRRQRLQQVLEESGWFQRIYPGQANFLLAELAGHGDGHSLQQHLAPWNILLRVCDTFTGLDRRHVRFAVKDEAAIEHLAGALQAIRQ